MLFVQLMIYNSVTECNPIGNSNPKLQITLKEMIRYVQINLQSKIELSVFIRRGARKWIGMEALYYTKPHRPLLCR